MAGVAMCLETFDRVDVLVGDGGDRLKGNRGDDVIDGRDGPDKITGGAGDDTVDGGSHHDWLADGPGFDTYDGGTAPRGDRLDLRRSPVGVTVVLLDNTAGTVTTNNQRAVIGTFSGI